MLLLLWGKLLPWFHNILEYLRSPKAKFILNGELLYKSREMISEFKFFMYFMDETVTLKNS